MKATISRMRATQCVRLLLLVGLGALARVASADDQTASTRAAVVRPRDQWLVLYKDNKGAEATEQATKAGFQIRENYKPGKYLLCEAGSAIADVPGTAKALEKLDSVLAVEPNEVVSHPQLPGEARRLEIAYVPPRRPDGKESAQAIDGPLTARAAKPDDPFFPKLWGLMNIHAPYAWERGHDSPKVIVGIIDTGVDYNHPDLRSNMWRNPGETPGNRMDDDKNGIVDDVFGVKYANATGTGDPMDDEQHGTHCAGIIGAVGNRIGVVGVCWNVKIMALKGLQADGNGKPDDLVRCIDYAIQQNTKINDGDPKVRVLCSSWASKTYSPTLHRAIGRAEQAGIIFVAPADNTNTDNDVSPVYPACYPNDNIIAVASINAADEKSAFSNYGQDSVHIAAPGGTGRPFNDDDIYSTVPNNRYDFLAGTSMANAFVAGASALVLARPEYSKLRPDQVRKLLMINARARPTLSGNCQSNGTLDLSFLAR
jgi:subtilisin family serine protease